TIAIRHGATVADEIKTKLALGRFDAAVGLALRRFEVAHLDVADERSLRNVLQRLPQNFQALAHLKQSHVVTIKNVADAAERHAEIKPVVDAVVIHLANVVIHAAGAQHRSGDAGVDGQIARKNPDVLRACQENFVAGEKLVELVKEPRI